MADPWGHDDSNSFGITLPAADPNDPNWRWDYSWLNPYGEFILNIPNTMPGPLSPQSINGSPLLYTDPQAYFAQRDAAKGLAGLGSDTISGGGGSNNLAGDVGIDPAISRAHEFNLDYAPPGSLLRYDPVHKFIGDEGPSLYVTAHPGFFDVPLNPEYHTAIRILGDDGVVDTLGGQLDFSTKNLVSAPNYARDQEAPVIVRLPVPANQTPQRFADNLRAAANAYRDNQRYNLFPGWANTPGYNSNSYVAGVIRAAGGVPPSLPVDVPGYGKPLPLNYAPNR